MKTSNIIILSVIALFFISTIGTNLALRKEFKKIDKADPSYGYSKEVLKPFKYVRLHGSGFGLTQIQQGVEPQIRMITKKEYLDWKISNDTLVLTYKADWNKANEFGDLSGKPSIYITAPQLSAISSDNIRYRVVKFKFKELSLDQKGLETLFSQTSAEKLNVTVTSGGNLRFDEKNQFGNASIDISDKSSLEIDKNIFASLQTRIDSSSKVRVPGSLINVLNNK